MTAAPSRATVQPLHDLFAAAEIGALSPSSPAQPASCSAAPLLPFSLSQAAAEALFIAAEAKAVLLAAQDRLAQALADLDRLVDAGLLPERGLPLVSGYTIYRQEGRVSWSYPASIKQLEAEVKKHKQLAEQLGEATQKRGASFWTIKPEEA